MADKVKVSAFLHTASADRTEIRDADRPPSILARLSLESDHTELAQARSDAKGKVVFDVDGWSQEKLMPQRLRLEVEHTPQAGFGSPWGQVQLATTMGDGSGGISLGDVVLVNNFRTLTLGGGGFWSEFDFPYVGIPWFQFLHLVADPAKKLLSLQTALEGQAIPLEAAFVDAAAQVTAARESVSRAGAKLGNVSLNVKFLALPGGLAQFLPRSALDQLSPAALGALSSATLDIGVPPPPTSAAAERAEVPTVVDYTEAVARRKLQTAGFYVATNVEIVPAPASGDPSREGRVVRQLPAGGASAARESVVQLFIGKEATS